MARRRFSRAGMGKGIDGLMAGAAANLASGYMGPAIGVPLATYGVGVWRNNDTLQTMGGFSAGAALASMLSLPGASAPGAGGLL